MILLIFYYYDMMLWYDIIANDWWYLYCEMIHWWYSISGIFCSNDADIYYILLNVFIDDSDDTVVLICYISSEYIINMIYNIEYSIVMIM